MNGSVSPRNFEKTSGNRVLHKYASGMEYGVSTRLRDGLNHFLQMKLTSHEKVNDCDSSLVIARIRPRVWRIEDCELKINLFKMDLVSRVVIVNFLNILI